MAMMDEATIARIIESQGYSATFPGRAKAAGDGTTYSYVYAWKTRKQGRSLGPLSAVASLSETELVQRLTEKFKGSQA